MVVKLNTDGIAEIVTKCTAKKPYRAAVVAKTVKTKKVLDEIKAALSANNVSYWCVNICYLTYMFYIHNNGSTIEVVDNCVYRGKTHIFHLVGHNGNGFRIFTHI